MSPQSRYLGVDVSKDTLVVAFAGQRWKLPNSKEGFRQLLARIKKQAGVCHVACESTGPYQLQMCLALQEAGVAVSICNAAQIHFYGLSEGLMAKNDPLDAALIERFANARRPPADPPLCREQIALGELIKHRQHMVESVAALRVYQQQVIDVTIRKVIDRSIKMMEKEVKALRIALQKRVEANPQWKTKMEVLMSQKGVGFLTAIVLLVKMPELGSLNRGQCAALAGVAPYDDDSGRAENKRCIKGGRIDVRNALYMAALTAIRHNPFLKAFYDRLLKERKAPKVALTAVMRKMIVYLNALLKQTAPVSPA